MATSPLCQRTPVLDTSCDCGLLMQKSVGSFTNRWEKGNASMGAVPWASSAPWPRLALCWWGLVALIIPKAGLVNPISWPTKLVTILPWKQAPSQPLTSPLFLPPIPASWLEAWVWNPNKQMVRGKDPQMYAYTQPPTPEQQKQH